MSNTNVTKLVQPGTFSDQLTDILRDGARTLLAQAVKAEVADFVAGHANLKTDAGHQRVVRHGQLPEREVMTGIGPVAVRQPRVRDLEVSAQNAERIKFTPTILSPSRGARRASMCCCRSFTSKVSRPAISPKRWPPCSGLTWIMHDGDQFAGRVDGRTGSFGRE